MSFKWLFSTNLASLALFMVFQQNVVSLQDFILEMLGIILGVFFYKKKYGWV